MSIAAMNWALRQRLASPLQQILLYVIADSADPEGLTRYCDPAYMESHARLTRATMFRMLRELEEKTLLQRRKFFTEKGDARYEIVLNMSIVVIEPIRRRRKHGDSALDTSDGGEDDAETQDEAMNATPESHSETLESRDHSLTGAQAKSQSCDYHRDDPSLPREESPPYPPPGGRSRLEVERQERRNQLNKRFLESYPSIKVTSHALAIEALDALSLEDAEWAVCVIPALTAELARLGDRTPKNAHVWLKNRMFENFPKVPLAEPPPPEIWIAEGSDEDRALRFVRAWVRIPSPMLRKNAAGVPGYPNAVEVGADLLAMLAFAAQSRLRWAFVEAGSAEYAAWRQRLWLWVGGELRPEPGERGIRVPSQFPPSKDGIIYDSDDESDNREAQG